MNGLKFITARFTNNDRTTVEVTWEDPEENLVATYHEAIKGDAVWKEVLENITLAEIEDNTRNYIKDQRTAYEAMVKSIGIKEGLLVSEKSQTDKSLFEIINEIEKDSEKLFKVKLEIFERPEVKSSKNKTWKAKMRKSTSVLELLSLLHVGPGDQESAQS